ncbi:MAG: sensor histidine kinase [Microcystaceae cyanobacterium]
MGDIPGTGLGLSIVKRYVELQGGTIDCVSEVNQGTTFSLCFPLYSP